LFLKGAKCDSPACPVEKRPYPPGQHGRNRTKESEYLLQKREKQKCARIYGVLEKQFRSYYEEANRQQGKTGENLLTILESRLDNVVYRAGWPRAATWPASWCATVTSPSTARRSTSRYRVSPNDIVEVRNKSREMTPFVVATPRPASARFRRGSRSSRRTARPRALPAQAGADRHAGAGTAHRRALLEVTRSTALRFLGRHIAVVPERKRKCRSPVGQY
jgi:hypothetical protein